MDLCVCFVEEEVEVVKRVQSESSNVFFSNTIFRLVIRIAFNSLRRQRTCITRAVVAPQLPQGGGIVIPRGGCGTASESMPHAADVDDEDEDEEDGAHAPPPALLSWKLLLLLDCDPFEDASSPAAPRKTAIVSPGSAEVIFRFF